MTPAELKKELETILSVGVSSPAFEAMQIMAFTEAPKAIIGQAAGNISEEQRQKALSIVHERLSGRPLQYILGEWEFWGIPLYVGEGVLIPRPETELIPEIVQKNCDSNEHLKIADACSGSGCIALALAKEFPLSHIYAYEKSPEAYSFLLRNVKRNSAINILPICEDICETTLFPESGFDIVVSNPPYIKVSEIETLQKEVQREPVMALAGGEDGLFFYRVLAKRFIPTLKKGGLAVFEIGEEQGDCVMDILKEAGLVEVTLHKDYAGLPRVVTGKR